MAATVGRALILQWGAGATPPTIRGKELSLTMNGEPIDVSDNGSAGWRELLTVPGQKQVDLSINGITRDRSLLAAWFAGDLAEPAVLTYDDGAKVEGTFFLSNLVDTGPYNDALTFEATLMSSGPVTYTPAP